jgi:acyl-CoA thioester hydrolase
MKVIETRIQKRFADIDMFRHVNNIHQQQYLDLGKTDYYRRVLELDALLHDPTLVIVSVKTDFVGQVRYEDEIMVRTWVERVGSKSITLRQQIVCMGAGGVSSSGETGAGAKTDAGSESVPETVLTESESVLVAFDLSTQSTVEVSTLWRNRISAE